MDHLGVSYILAKQDMKFKLNTKVMSGDDGDEGVKISTQDYRRHGLLLHFSEGSRSNPLPRVSAELG